MDWSLVLGVALFAVFMVVASLIDRRESRQRREAAASLESRPAQGVEEIVRGVSGVPPEVAQRVLRILAEVSEFSLSPPKVSIEPGRLRASDTLLQDLGYDFDSLAFCELGLRLEKEFGIKLAGSDFTAPPAVGDIVRLVGERVARVDRRQDG